MIFRVEITIYIYINIHLHTQKRRKENIEKVENVFGTPAFICVVNINSDSLQRRDWK